MRLLIDTNILVDKLRTREPHHKAAGLLLALGWLGEFELWMTSSQFGDLCYVLTKGGKHSLAPLVAQELREIRKFVNVCSPGPAEVDAALESGWTDLEDALLFQAAKCIKANAIITRNQADFGPCSIPVYDCEQFFEHYAHTTGIAYSEICLP